MGRNLLFGDTIMKKRISILLILSIVLVIFSGCHGRKATHEGYTLYRSSPVGVEIEYPSFWEMVDDNKKCRVAFASPNEGFADPVRDNVTILCEQIGTDDLAFDNYVQNYLEQLPSSIANYNHVSEQEMKVGELDAYRVIYEGTTTEGDLRMQQTFIKSGKYMYIYTFMAEPRSYEYFEKNSNIMLSTFKALKK